MFQSFYYRGKSHRCYWVGIWVGPRAPLGAAEKRTILALPAIKPEFLCPIPNSLVSTQPDLL
jgi:hypothetical protein